MSYLLNDSVGQISFKIELHKFLAKRGLADHVDIELVHCPDKARPILRVEGNFLTAEDFVDAAWERNR